MVAKKLFWLVWGKLDRCLCEICLDITFMWVEYFYMIWNHFLCEKKRLSADAVVKNLTRESCKSAWVPDKENYNIQLTSSKQYLKRQWSKYSFQVLINEYFFDSAWGCSALASDNILTCPNKAMQLDPWVKASRDPWCRSNRAWTSQGWRPAKERRLKAAEVIFAKTNTDNGESTSESSHSSSKNYNNDNDKNEEPGKESADGKSQIYLAIFVIMKYKSQNHFQCFFSLLQNPF